MIKKGDQTRRAINRLDYVDGWFSQRKKNKELEGKLDEIEEELERHRDFFELFKL